MKAMALRFWRSVANLNASRRTCCSCASSSSNINPAPTNAATPNTKKGARQPLAVMSKPMIGTPIMPASPHVISIAPVTRPRRANGTRSLT